MKEAHRVLRPGGSLLIPNFPSILSRNGLHLKYGFNIPWANLLFSDETIIKTLRRIAQNDATMYSVYPGLSGECNEIKDVRRYKDLNGMKYARFKQLAKQADFQIVDFTVSPSGYLVSFKIQSCSLCCTELKAPDFSHRNSGRKFRRINPDYSIEFEDKGSRTLYTRDNGLSRLFLDGGLNLVANVGLDDSGAYGRVVVMKTGEAGSQNLLNDYIKTLKEKEDQEIESVKARY